MTDRKRPKRRRLTSEARRDHIVAAAIDFFAREGFSGSTRDLARQAGITQPLIYRYFPTKQDLIRAVYNEVFVGRWKPEWEATIRDRARPIAERLRDFYLEYTEVVFQGEWMRIYIHSGLMGLDINRWWSEFVEERLLVIICDELRLHHGRESVAARPAGPLELELMWSFQGSLFYYAIRRDIYGAPVHADFPAYLDLALDTLLAESARLMAPAA